jgi:hypothetical protein
MQVLGVTHQYHPAIGGAKKHIAGVIEEFVRHGREVAFDPDVVTWMA